MKPAPVVGGAESAGHATYRETSTGQIAEAEQSKDSEHAPTASDAYIVEQSTRHTVSPKPFCVRLAQNFLQLLTLSSSCPLHATLSLLPPSEQLRLCSSCQQLGIQPLLRQPSQRVVLQLDSPVQAAKYSILADKTNDDNAVVPSVSANEHVSHQLGSESSSPVYACVSSITNKFGLLLRAPPNLSIETRSTFQAERQA